MFRQTDGQTRTNLNAHPLRFEGQNKSAIHTKFYLLVLGSVHFLTGFKSHTNGLLISLLRLYTSNKVILFTSNCKLLHMNL